MSTRLSSETVHASAVAIGGRAVLIGGKSAAGKSDLALRLIDRGGALIADDYTLVRRSGEQALAVAPDTIGGKIEVRGLGIVEMKAVRDIPIGLYVDLDHAPERLPEPGETLAIAGLAIPVLRLAGLEASAPIKVELALDAIGLRP